MAISENRLVVLLRVILVLLILSTLNALRIFHFMPERFDAAFPGAIGFLRGAFITASYIGLVSLFGLMLFKQWALLAFVLVSIAAIILDILVKAPVFHQVAVAVSAGVVSGLSWRLRSRFLIH